MSLLKLLYKLQKKKEKKKMYVLKKAVKQSLSFSNQICVLGLERGCTQYQS